MTTQRKQVWPFGPDLILTPHINSVSHTEIGRRWRRGITPVSLCERLAEHLSHYTLSRPHVGNPRGEDKRPEENGEPIKKQALESADTVKTGGELDGSSRGNRAMRGERREREWKDVLRANCNANSNGYVLYSRLPRKKESLWNRSFV